MIKTASTPKKVISIYVAISLLASSILPTRVNAITGPSAPEFSSFESVTSNNMVSDFSGDFSYNLPIITIPGPDGAGYALSLSYKNASPDEDASWVGYGWTLSPGAIVRSKSGFPDDANGVSMTSYNDIPINWTAGLGLNAGVTLEGLSLSASIGEALLLQYNNHQGFSYSAIPNIGVAAGYGLVSLNLALEDGKGSFSAAVNPAAIVTCIQKGKEKASAANEKQTEAQPTTEASEETADDYATRQVIKGSGQYSNAFVSYLADNKSRNTNIPSYTAGSFKLQVGVQGEPGCIHIGLGADMYGTYSYQKAVEKSTFSCYGYLYSANASATDALMDYYTEKDQSYNKRDYNLSIPYSRPDNFILMGEGLSGGFRAFSKNAGHFRMNEVTNETVMAQLGIDVMLGADIGVGGSGQMGYHSIVQSDWDDNGENDAYNFNNSGDEAFYMSFTMDPSQYMSYGGDANDLEAQAFSLEQTSGTPGAKSYIPKAPTTLHSSVDAEDDNNKRIPRSSQVIYHTNKQMTADIDNGGNYYNRYSRPEATYERFLDRSAADVQDQIGEFVVYNNTGSQYVYGLPVFSQKESSMSYDIDSLSMSKDYIVKSNISYYQRKVGDSTGTPYATSWLLTAITTPNYIDRTMDGPSADDFGGWTQFKYAKNYGNKTTSGKWYHWRVPYNGLYNNPGSLTDDKDDMGSFSSGDKEIYLLDTIETKTNIAIFYKSKRTDGYDAADDKTAANSLTAQGSNAIERLDSIYLYAKDASGAVSEIIKRVYFKYDYSLMQGVLNAKGVAGSDGVLTLKNVWFEYGNVRNATLSPYAFSYSYPVDGTYPTKYSNLDNYGGYSSSAQNPSYNKCNIDRWGSYQYNGASRSSILNTWVDQTPNTTNFDPAAWQLKAITLPTGGQVHVQYEQDDYRHVQDRRAMAMVSLSSIVQPGNFTIASVAHPEGNLGDKYYLKLNDLGISSATDKAALVEQLQKQFVDGEGGHDPEKIYFKFLYSLTVSTASLGSCGSDYITGYVNVAAVGSDATGVYLQLGSSTSSVEILDDDETYSIPRQVCIDFYDKTRVGNLNSNDLACNLQGIQEESNNEDGATAAIYALLGVVNDNMLMEDHSSLCLDIDESNSYLRIPIITSKIGGGLRVKRLLMYDAGVESNDASLYGKEYVYQNNDGLSSGVASNEPALGRDESALVTYLDKRRDSNILQKIMSGEDLDQFEGPYGDGCLPGASVGYSRVVAKNIHTDKNTNDGFSVSEFLTTYDYPFDKKYSYKDASGNTVSYDGVDETEMEQKTDWLPLYALIYNRVVNNAWASQGYRFIVNDMNGKPKKNAVYSGDYNYINIPDSLIQISGEEYSYYEPLEPVPVVSRWEWKNEAAMVPEYRIMGKQMDVVTESRAIKDHLIDETLEIDASIGICGPVVIPWLSGMPYINETIGELYTHVTNKVIYAPTQLKGIRKYQDGIYVNSHTEYFDANTGEPMVSITNDGYNDLTLDGAVHDGRYVNYSFPAAHYFDGMGLRSNTDGYHLPTPSNYKKNKDASGNLYLEYTSTGCALDVLTPGDLLALTSTGGIKEVYNVGEIVGKTAQLLPNGDFYYDINEYDMADIAIVRTAKTNQIGESVGGVTTYGGYPKVTNIPIDASILTARKQVATKLNSMISGSGTVTAALSYPTVSIIDASGNCVPLSLSVTSKRFNEAVYYNYYDTVVACTEVNCTYPMTGTKVGDGPMLLTPIPGSTPTNDQYETYYTSNTTGTLVPHYKCFDCDTTYPVTKKTKYIPKITLTVGSCTITFTYTSTYKFYIDTQTGELMYGKESEPCDAVRVDCFDFCPDKYASVELDGVVGSSAAWLSDDWDLSSTLKTVYDIPGSDLNEYEYGAKGKWHGKYSYDYNTSVSTRTASAGRVWDAGIYDDFTVFNWDYEEANDGIWTMLNTTTKVSPYGATLEEKNALGIYSCLKMGYDFSLPYITAVNSTYNNVMFESFENYTTGCTGASMMCFEDGYAINTASSYYGKLVSDTAHSGDQSLRMKFVKSSSTSLKGGTTYIFESELSLQAITLNDQVINEGVSVKLWMKSDKTVATFSLKYKKPASTVYSSVSFNKVAQTGEWTLYEARITKTDWDAASITTADNSITPIVYMKNSSMLSIATAPKVYLDDVRMQPLDAQATAYVYDPETLRLLASFDDQHFALFYQYNSEGKLVRKLKETVEGVKTITETQYNVPKSTRP